MKSYPASKTDPIEAFAIAMAPRQISAKVWGTDTSYTPTENR